MFPKQRREKILEILNSAGHATVEELAREFGVSVDSIRKDLKVLSDAGLCRREYGGALRVGGPVAQAPAAPASPVLADTSDDTLLGDEGRMAVARRAYMEINDGDAIFLDISRTNLYLADIIAAGDKRLIVTTNMIEIPQRLAANPKVTALATGGYLNAQLTGFIGSATISLLEPLLFAKAFIGANGVDLATSAVLAHDMDDGMVKEKALKNASYRFLLADKAKFHIGGGYRFASINDFTAVITDETDPEVLRAIVRTGTPALC
ncbi:DeoR family transcriptional regulator [Olsenella profusa]|uniref:DeoR/GlpR transcriptional regulator n=1 Tax=Olsenella profusa TaxID=138595 RepID=A0ABS2F1L6_9ACTN|nr:DeoR/GlpR transcriptional regulator [Olsenella profusa]